MKFCIVALIPFIYLLFRFILPLKIRWYWKIPMTFFLLLITHFYVMILFYYFFPSWFNLTKCPKWFLSTGMYIYVTTGIYFAISFFADIFQIFLHIIQKILKNKNPVHWIFRPAKINLLLIIPAIGFTALGMHLGTVPPRVREITIPYPNLPESMDGLKLVLIADTHILQETPLEYIQEIRCRTNQQNPDFVFLAGDIVDDCPGNLEEKINELSKIKSSYGTFFITGNHDGWNVLEKWNDFYRKRGINVLMDQHVDFPELHLSIIGLKDRAHETALPEVMKNIPANSFKILLEHRPKRARQNAKAGIDLQLSGHTHGGMIFLLYFVVSAMNSGFVSGLYHIDNMYLCITNGLCVWRGFPIRLGVPPEIVLIRLKRTENGQ